MIVYLHGFNSSPESRKATYLRDVMERAGLGAHYACPALPDRPAEAIARIERLLRRHDMAAPLAAPWAAPPVTLLGSSLGGFYATWLAERHGLRAVLINPAVHPERDLAKYLGPQQNLYTSERYVLGPTHVAELEALVVRTPLHTARYLLLVETDDEVLDYREAVRRYAGARQVIVPGGDHTLRTFPDHLALVFAFAGLPAPV